MENSFDKKSVRTRLTTHIKTLAENQIIQKATTFFDGFVYPALYAFLVLLTSLFGLELFFYALTTIILIFTSIFSKSSKAILPPLLLIVYSTSWKHTPQPPYSSDFFNSVSTIVFIAVCALFIICAVAVRFVLFPQPSSKKYLRSGLIAFSAALILNGALYFNYEIKDFFFGILIAVSFAAAYFYLSKTLSAKEKWSEYIAYLLFLASAVIALQIVKVLIFDDVFTAEGSINKDRMIAGWGMSNNLGGMLSIFLPASLYLACKKKNGWIYYLCSFVFAGTVCFTLSRTALLVAAVVLLAGMIILSVRKSQYRNLFRLFNVIVIAVGILFGLLYFEKILNVFATVFDRGFSDSNRFQIWKNGLKNFLVAPIFGVGFYESFHVFIGIENWFFPDMYHNLFIQILACCGIFGIFAYAFHLSQVFNLFSQKINAESLFYMSILLTLCGASLLDNHLFHVFPAIVYSVILAVWDLQPVDPAIKQTFLRRQLQRGFKTNHRNKNI